VWLIGAMVCLLAATWVQLSVSAGNGWPHNALRQHWLMPISCHFQDCKALLVTSLTDVSGAIAGVLTFTFTSNCSLQLDIGLLRKLQLCSLEQRRLHFVLHMCYRIIFGSSDLWMYVSDFFELNSTSQTRGHPYKLYKPRTYNTVRASYS